VLVSCLAILVYLLVALDTKNLLILLLVMIFMALPLTIAFFMVDRKIKYWQSPYQLYSQEFSYKPKLKSGMQVPIQVEYQFPVAVNTPDVLQRIDTVAESAINQSFSSLYTPIGYEETRKAIVDGLDQELQKLDIEVFRVRVLKIDFLSSREQFDSDVMSVSVSSLVWQKFIPSR
jgi:flagellar basal body-associated protein FliL